MFRKTSAMVESGILAAIAIVMALISMYVPVAGVFVNFVWPLPIIICGMRHGMKWSLMSLAVAGIIVAIIISPLQAFFLVAIFGLMGIVLGECMRRRMPPMRLMFFGSIGAVVALILNVVLSFAVLGINPIEMMFTSFNQSLTELATYYREQGMSEADIKTAIQGYEELLSMMRIIMPGAFLVSAPALAFVNYWAAKKILVKLGETFEPFPPFSQLQIPGWILWPYGASLFAVTYFYLNDRNSWMYDLAVNVQTVTSFALVLQGICLIYWFVEHKKKPAWWAHTTTTLMFFIPLFSQMIVYVGAFDIVFDYRKIRSKRLR